MPTNYPDVGRLVNWAHPLNRSLSRWYRVVPAPGWTGSKTHRDIVGCSARNPANHGTLTNYSPTGVAWSGHSHPGGHGTILYTSSSSHYTSIPTWAPGTGNFTVSCWFRSASWGGSGTITPILANTTYGNAIGVYSNGTQRGTGCRLNNSLTADFGNYLTTTIWFHLTVTRSGTGITSYLNGKSVGTQTNGQTCTFNTLANHNAASADPYWNGRINDVRLYLRSMSAAEAAWLYKESYAGYPNALNWLEPAELLAPEAAAGASTQPPRTMHQFRLRGAA